MQAKEYKKIVVKVGSNVITRADGFPDEDRLAQLVSQLATLMKMGIQVVLVSSGAVASGRSIIKISEKADPVAARQQLAAVGQIKLINTYAKLFEKHKLVCAQVLVTKGDFRDRLHYQNMKGCVNNLLQNSIIPIVNENDVIAVTELMFTDNDELSGLIASMISADALVLLTSVDGLYDGAFGSPDAKLISQVDETQTDFSFITQEKSSFGRGGMVTKSRMASKVARVGITVHVANGKTDDILLQLVKGAKTGTTFVPTKTKSGVKRRLAHAEGFAKGEVMVNNGVLQVLSGSGKAVSLLPVGIVKVTGNFEKNDVIKIVAEDGRFIGIGVAGYGADKAKARMGQSKQPALVHYDYLYLNAE
ncbi:MAG: glutamate 5-kinase [Sphingobacteriales bacterium JAD_PAG50586_3]|nr:MAG: glutamate 5-kinase [Sphingobacteriales bacterium JAD_PAG50586_3]